MAQFPSWWFQPNWKILLGVPPLPGWQRTSSWEARRQEGPFKALDLPAVSRLESGLGMAGGWNPLGKELCKNANQQPGQPKKDILPICKT